VTVEESMWTAISYSLGVLYTEIDWQYEDSIFLDGCHGITCGTVDYDVSLTRTYTFTQTSGIPLAAGTDTNLKNPNVVWVNYAGGAIPAYVEFD
jgi:hypothetical protein